MEKDSLADTPWPMHGHDRRHTGRSPFIGPQTSNVKWSIESDTFFFGSPSIDLDGNIIVGTVDSGLYCIRPDGTINWIFEETSYITGTPAIARDGTIYFGEGGFDNLIALNPDGSYKWGLGDLGGSLKSSPAIAKDGTIYFGAASHLYAVNPDGSIKWIYQTAGIIRTSPAIDNNGNVCFGGIDEYIYVLRPDGSLLWKFLTESAIYASPAIADDGTIYCYDRIFLYALSQGGFLIWKKYLGEYTEGSPSVGKNGTIYMSNGQWFFAFHPDGTQKWKIPVTYSRPSPVEDSDGTIYIHGNYEQDTLVAINHDGTIKWSIYLDNSGYATPCIDASRTLYVGSLYKFYAIQDAQISTPSINPIGLAGILSGISVFIYFACKKES